MKSLIVSIVIGFGLVGCTGVISKHEYTKEDVEKAKKAYETVKKIVELKSTIKE